MVEVLMLQPTPVGRLGSVDGAVHASRSKVDGVHVPAVDILKDRLAGAVRHPYRYGMVCQSLRLELDRVQPGSFRGAGYLLVDQFLALQFQHETCFFQPAYRTEGDQEVQIAIASLGYRQA